MVRLEIENNKTSRKEIKTQIDGKTSFVHELKDLLLR